MPKAYSYVRMSTPEQLRGASLSRQLQRTKEYCIKHNLELDDKLVFHDIGVSGWKGDNLTQGALGKFIEAVRNGQIARGSYLLVESLDRLSRDTLFNAASLLLTLLNMDIILITLAPHEQRRFDKHSNNDLMFSFGTLDRAHAESQRKSELIADAWERKRTKIRDEKLTSKAPAWLRLSKDRKSFVAIPERAGVVKRVFELAAIGVGSYSIAALLNKDNVAEFKDPGRQNPIRRASGWQKSYIQKILTNEAVIGRFQPMLKRDRKRIPSGPALDDYYPPVISQEQFFHVKSIRSQRRLNGGGRVGPTVNNLFSRIARCGYCRGAMHFIDKGKKGTRWLVCDRSRRNLSKYSHCGDTGVGKWQYDQFETSFLTFVEELDIDRILNKGESAVAELNDITQRRNAAEAMIAELAKRRLRLVRALANGDVEEDLMRNEVSLLSDRIREHEKELEEFKNRIAKIESGRQILKSSACHVGNSIDRLRQCPPNRLYEVRAELSQHIRSLVKCVFIYPHGKPSEDVEKQIRSMEQLLPSDLIYRQVEFDFVLSNSPTFAVEFQNDKLLLVALSTENPRDFRIIESIHGGVQMAPDLSHIGDIKNDTTEYLHAEYEEYAQLMKDQLRADSVNLSRGAGAPNDGES